MINGIGAQFETQPVTLTTEISDDQGNTYAPGEHGEIVRQGHGDDPTILVHFDGRPHLCLEPGDFVIGRVALA